MKINPVVLAALCFSFFSPLANASAYNFSFAGPGVSGSINITYGTTTDGKYPQAFAVTGISGTFSDTNNGLNISNATITGLQPLNISAPESTNLLAPDDFSKFAVASGLPPEANGVLTYTNLFYPNGSPATATDYQVHGGFLDIYGLLFDLGNGDVVNFWSNGDFSGTGHGEIDYGVAVASSSTAFDYVSGGVAISPEPASYGLFGGALVAMLVLRRQKKVAS